MPIFVVPNSLGSTLTVEGNPCHEPGGSPKGGQFGKKGTCGTSATEPPATPSKKKYKKGENITNTTDNGDDRIERAVLGGKLGNEVAESILQYADESRFEVSYNTEGAVPNQDGENDERYQKWVDERVEAAESEAKTEYWNDFKLTHLQERLDEIRIIAEEALQGKKEDTTGYLYGQPPSRLIETPQVQSLLLAAGQDGQHWDTTRGGREFSYYTWERPLTEAQREAVRQYALANFAAGSRFTGDFGDIASKVPWTYLPPVARQEITPLGDYIANARQSAADESDYETWYDRYGRDSGSGTPTVNMEISGRDYSMTMRRNFMLEENGLHVHHSYWQFGDDAPPGEGKKIFRGMFEEYERMGMARMSTYANIDVGVYAWARYGFVPTSHRGMASRLASNASTELQLDRVGHYRDQITVSGKRKDVTVTFTPTEKMRNAAMKLLTRYQNDPTDRNFWAIVDAKWRKAGTARSYGGTTYPVDVSLGKMLMLSLGGWDADFRFSNKAQVDRIKKYIYGKKR